MPSEIRWSIRAAASEFSMSEVTLKRRLQEANEVAGDDGHFSSIQLRQAFSGNWEAARTEKARVDAELQRVKIEILKKDFVRRSSLLLVLGNGLSLIRRAIDRAAMDPASKVTLLKLLAAPPEKLLESVPEGVEKVVRNKRQKTRGRNGKVQA
jgi:hypothetical protein